MVVSDLMTQNGSETPSFSSRCINMINISTHVSIHAIAIDL